MSEDGVNQCHCNYVMMSQSLINPPCNKIQNSHHTTVVSRAWYKIFGQAVDIIIVLFPSCKLASLIIHQ